MTPIVVQNSKLLPYMTDRYDLKGLGRLRQLLERQGAFRFKPLRTHLYAAAVVAPSNVHSGYEHCWVRDNVHISHAFYLTDQTRAAVRIMSALMRFYTKHRQRFVDVIEARVNRSDAMTRPHVRFNGATLEESKQTWAHAQNDALGYFLWMYGTLASKGLVKPSVDEIETLKLFPPYFDAIRYWEDEDSGHWEEMRKVEASSIGAVVAGLKALRAWLDGDDGVKQLEQRGQFALEKILPFECIDESLTKRRRYDAALVFLVFPLDVVGAAMGRRILKDIAEALEGPFGIKRYLGDSYWAGDYKDKVTASQRTADFSDSLEARDQLLAKGQEAQWCLFDPIMSAAYGRRYHRTGKKMDLDLQTHYFNRSIGQLTGNVEGVKEFRCPEAYYLQYGRYVPNDQTPLLWTQANLLIAMTLMEQSLSA
jgi:phosphorylase kinase alpha/beta subunit